MHACASIKIGICIVEQILSTDTTCRDATCMHEEMQRVSSKRLINRLQSYMHSLLTRQKYCHYRAVRVSPACMDDLTSCVSRPVDHRRGMDGWTDILIQSDTEHKALWSWHYGQYKQVGGAACAAVRWCETLQ